MIELLENISIIGPSLYLKEQKCLVLGDLHIGIEESLGDQGYMLPKKNFLKLKEELKAILEEIEVKTVVLNGDIKHEFGRINYDEWNDSLELIDSFKDKKLILIKGNHDKTTQIIAKKRNLEVKDHYLIDDIFICHGDILFKDYFNAKTIIIGHEHPAISLTEGAKTELFKCFLLGKFEKKNLIVLPSFSFINIGSDILKYNKLSPYLQQDLNNFKVFIIEGKEIYDFGRVKNL